jgi:hypothetical protein
MSHNINTLVPGTFMTPTELTTGISTSGITSTTTAATGHRSGSTRILVRSSTNSPPEMAFPITPAVAVARTLILPPRRRSIASSRAVRRGGCMPPWRAGGRPTPSSRMGSRAVTPLPGRQSGNPLFVPRTDGWQGAPYDRGDSGRGSPRP